MRIEQYSDIFVVLGDNDQPLFEGSSDECARYIEVRLQKINSHRLSRPRFDRRIFRSPQLGLKKSIQEDEI